MDLVVTEQMEDPHVVYAVGDAEVDKGSWSRGGCQGTPAKETQLGGDMLREERYQLIVRRGIYIYSYLLYCF